MELGNSAPYILSKVDGLGDVLATNHTQKAPYQDGTTYIDTLMEERFITLQVGIVANGNLSEGRQTFASIFNPKIGESTLRYINGNSVKEIKAISEHVPIFPSSKENRSRNTQMAMLTLRCPIPFWQDVQPTIDEMAVFVGKFGFPLEFSDYGIEMGDQGEKIIINNPGDVSAPVQIEFNGPAINPKVTNLTTGEYILVNRTVAEEQKLVLVTDFGKKRVEIHDEDGTVENAFAWIDLNSTFWQLQPGDNLIQYQADVGMDKARVYITHKNRYVGI